jgi:hypothetical protein
MPLTVRSTLGIALAHRRRIGPKIKRDHKQIAAVEDGNAGSEFFEFWQRGMSQI